jgi:zona occludens toxin (predicted ATPase)
MTKANNSKQKPEPSVPDAQAQRTRSWSRQRSVLYLLVVLIGLVGVSIVAVYGLTRKATVSPTETPGVMRTVADSSVTATATPPATAVPPTEPPKEVSLQQQLRDWLVTIGGVSKVSSLDIDVPDNEPPLVYAEIEVTPGYNDTRIPNIFVGKLNEALATTQYSDFVIIINDGAQVVEYDFDSKNVVWSETLLADNSTADLESDQ